MELHWGFCKFYIWLEGTGLVDFLRNKLNETNYFFFGFNSTAVSGVMPGTGLVPCDRTIRVTDAHF